MDRPERDAILIDLLGHLKNEGSWCGETHLQKAVYFLQHMTAVPLAFSFILYKHGPFSFDLRDELTALRADGLLTIQSNRPYGPSYVPTAQAGDLQRRYARAIAGYRDRIEFVAKALGKKQVSDLERVATALYVVLEGTPRTKPETFAKNIIKLKPHISSEDAREAVEEVSAMIDQAAGISR